MIYDSDIGHKIEDKFICTADITPTLLGLLGIRYYSNLYYGNSLFATTESVLYSRSYGVFLREGIVGTSASNIVYSYEGKTTSVGVVNATGAITPEQLSAFTNDSASLVEKIKYCDYLFKTDYFANAERMSVYENRMKALNNL